MGIFPDSSSIKIKKHIVDFILYSKRLSTLGIIVNELLTNIMKYAFAKQVNKLITVSALLNVNHIVIIIQDNGIGMPESFKTEHPFNFGHKLVSMLVKQLGGILKIESGNGTKIVIEFDK